MGKENHNPCCVFFQISTISINYLTIFVFTCLLLTHTRSTYAVTQNLSKFRIVTHLVTKIEENEEEEFKEGESSFTEIVKQLK